MLSVRMFHSHGRRYNVSGWRVRAGDQQQHSHARTYAHSSAHMRARGGERDGHVFTDANCNDAYRHHLALVGMGHWCCCPLVS